MQAPKPKLQQREQVPAGTHIARFYQYIEIGKIPVMWQGKEKKQAKIRLTFEFPDELREFGEKKEKKPMVLSSEYSFSMAPQSKLRPLIQSMIGVQLNDDEANAFDIDDLLDKHFLLNIVHAEVGDKTYANIASASPLMKGQVAPAGINPVKVLTYEKWDQEFFDKLPDFIQEKMKSSDEYKAKFGAVEKSIDPDEIPF